jgi:hypothetical protein
MSMNANQTTSSPILVQRLSRMTALHGSLAFTMFSGRLSPSLSHFISHSHRPQWTSSFFNQRNIGEYSRDNNPEFARFGIHRYHQVYCGGVEGEVTEPIYRYIPTTFLGPMAILTESAGEPLSLRATEKIKNCKTGMIYMTRIHK